MKYAAVLAAITDEREREDELIARWTRDVEAADNAMPPNPAHTVVRSITPGVLHPAEAVTLLAALFKGLAPNAYISGYRSALACISDAISELHGELESEPERDDGPDWDARHDERRDNARDFAS